jgi:hypothetical protein
MVSTPPGFAMLGLAQFLYAHVQRVGLDVRAIAYATSSRGAVASIVYAEDFDDQYIAIQQQATLNPDWYLRSRGPVLAWPEYDLAIREDNDVERTYAAVTFVSILFWSDRDTYSGPALSSQPIVIWRTTGNHDRAASLIRCGHKTYYLRHVHYYPI